MQPRYSLGAISKKQQTSPVDYRLSEGDSLAQSKCHLMSYSRTSVHLSPSSVGARDPPYACRSEEVTFLCQVINGLTLQWASEPDIPCNDPISYTPADIVGSYQSRLISIARNPPYSNFSSVLTFIPPQFVNNVTVQCGEQPPICSSTEAESQLCRQLCRQVCCNRLFFSTLGAKTISISEMSGWR